MCHVVAQDDNPYYTHTNAQDCLATYAGGIFHHQVQLLDLYSCSDHFLQIALPTGGDSHLMPTSASNVHKHIMYTYVAMYSGVVMMVKDNIQLDTYASYYQILCM